MIDYSNEIFNAVATDLRSGFGVKPYSTADEKTFAAEDETVLGVGDEMAIQIKGEYVATPTVFPTVTIDEITNIPAYLDSANQNKYAEVVYRVQTFCNGSGKRALARRIYSRVDAKLQELGLFAVSYTTTPSIYNSEVYCITATYRAVIDRNGVIYRG